MLLKTYSRPQMNTQNKSRSVGHFLIITDADHGQGPLRMSTELGTFQGG